MIFFEQTYYLICISLFAQLVLVFMFDVFIKKGKSGTKYNVCKLDSLWRFTLSFHQNKDCSRCSFCVDHVEIKLEDA